jgi:hypothetical protein
VSDIVTPDGDQGTGELEPRTLAEVFRAVQQTPLPVPLQNPALLPVGQLDPEVLERLAAELVLPPGQSGCVLLRPTRPGLGGVLGDGDLPEHYGILPVGAVGHRREQHQPALIVPAAAQILAWSKAARSRSHAPTARSSPSASSAISTRRSVPALSATNRSLATSQRAPSTHSSSCGRSAATDPSSR